MDGHIFRQLFPEQYLNKYLINAIRPDGRQSDKARQVIIEYIDKIVNYQYSETYMSAKYTIQEQNIKESDIQSCIILHIQLDTFEEINYLEKQRQEQYYLNILQNIIRQIVNFQICRINQEKANVIDINIRIAGQNGSLLSHLINCISFLLWQIKFNDQPIVIQEIKAQTYAIFQETLLVDPSLLEEQNSSTMTIVHFQDQNIYQIIKTDGKYMDQLIGLE